MPNILSVTRPQLILFFRKIFTTHARLFKDEAIYRPTKFEVFSSSGFEDMFNRMKKI